MAKGLKWNVYVVIETSTGVMKVVTSVDNCTKWAKWESGKEGKEMTLTTAKDLAWALSVNGYTAHVIQTLHKMSNPELRPAE